jgi:hypothetical protein
LYPTITSLLSQVVSFCFFRQKCCIHFASLPRFAEINEQKAEMDVYKSKWKWLVGGLFLLLPLGAKGIRETLRFTSAT